MTLPIPFVSPDEWDTLHNHDSSLNDIVPPVYEGFRCDCTNPDVSLCSCQIGCSCHYKKKVRGVPVILDILWGGVLPLYALNRKPVLTFTDGSWIEQSFNKRVLVPVYDWLPQDVLERGLERYQEKFNEMPSVILCCCRDARNAFTQGLALFGPFLGVCDG